MASQPIVIAYVVFANVVSVDYTPSQIDGPYGIGEVKRIKEEKAAHQLRSHTQGVKEYSVNLSNGRQYVFVDTPGFDDTYRSDRDILRTIAEWLEKKYRGKVKLSGIIYTHRITDNRISGSVCKNLDMFARLCGDKAASGVRLVTTMWDTVKDITIAENRVSQLESNFWKPLINEGARHKRFEGNSPRKKLVDVARKLNETTAGQALYTQFQKLLHEQKEAIKQLQEEAKAQKSPELVKQLEVEQRRLEAELQKTWDEMGKLKIPFMRRIALFFSKKPQSVSLA
ncbi:hypothetical protein F5141DRAFT_1213718 [Pisolithus sp. B1]|nr:hypothetical protein F5141DRAFT_1213718 [Pisolithus sp. B1]